MGEYFEAVNLTKREVLNPHSANSGAKWGEIRYGNFAPLLVFALHTRWAGDQVIIAGDEGRTGQNHLKTYDEADDWPDVTHDMVAAYLALDEKMGYRPDTDMRCTCDKCKR